jgi:hypothetical protein
MMSRLSRLKTASHGEDGKWAYEEITRLRAELEAAKAEVERIIGVNGEWFDKCERLQEQRDELLAALEAGRRLIELISPFEGDVTRQIDKAIDKARGEK